MKPNYARFLVCIIGLGIVAVVFLSGCASNGVVDACPYVRNENPSLLQGRTTGQ
jgi:hypothetical protein